MKQLFNRGIFLLAFIGIVGFSNTAKGQDNIGGLLEGGLGDANKLVEGYVAPFMNGFGAGMANGWYNTAKAHKTLGFDLTVTVNAAFVPNDDLFYDVDALNLETLTLTNPTDGKAPTMFGPATVPTYTENSTNETFNGPEGLNIKDEIGLQAVPVPMAQLGIGIVKNTDIKIRWTPEIEIDDNSNFKLIGFGVMHDIKQYIPGVKNAPFDLAGFVGYTKMTLTADPVDAYTAGSGGGVYSDNDEGKFQVNSLTIQALISKKFSILTLYGGIGFNSVKSKIALEGDYTIRDDLEFIEETYQNPIDLKFNTGGPRMTAGFRLKLAILTIHADYTLQKYSTLSMGVGFAVR